MSAKNSEVLKCGVIPAGTRIKLYEAPFILQEDVKVDASQEFIDKVLKDLNDFEKGVDVALDPNILLKPIP